MRTNRGERSGSSTVAAWEERFGPLTDAEVAEADRLLDRPTKAAAKKTPRRRGGA